MLSFDKKSLEVVWTGLVGTTSNPKFCHSQHRERGKMMPTARRVECRSGEPAQCIAVEVPDNLVEL